MITRNWDDPGTIKPSGRFPGAIQPSTIPLQVGLTGYYELEEGSGIPRVDQLAIGTLVEVGGTTGNASGKIANAASFVGSNSRQLEATELQQFTFTDQGTYNLLVDFSISVWIKPATLSGFPVVFVLRNTSDSSNLFVLYYDASASAITFSLSATGTTATAQGPNLSTGTWYHVVCTHTAATNTISIIVNNGTPVTATYSGTVHAPSNKFQLGASSDQVLYWDGLIDEFGTWDRVLTSTEITNLYNSGSGLAWPLVPSSGSTGSSTLIFIPTSVGSSLADDTGSSSLTFTVSGIGDALADAAASSSITFSVSSTGSVLADGTASSSIIFTPTGLSDNLADATGASSLTFSVSAVSGTDATGSSQITFTPTGVADALADTSGSSSLTFSVVATGAATFDAAGSSSITFTATATGIAFFDATGSSSLTFTASAAADTSGSTGSSSITFTVTAIGASLADGTAVALITFTAAAISPSILAGDLAGIYPRPTSAWNRTVQRPLSTWNRTWGYIPVATPLLSQQATLYATVSDDRDYLFDYTAAPEIAAGLTIDSAVMLGGVGLVVSSPVVTTDVQDGIAIGKGVLVRISGGIAGKIYGVACKASLSNGRTIVIPGRLAIDPDTVPNKPLP